MSIWAAGFLLFLILDPIGNIPVFLTLLQRVPPERRRRVLLRELLFALAVLVGFLLAGQVVLDFLRLEPESISIAGGVILFIIALRMIFPERRGGALADELDSEPFLVPLAVPLIAGPSTVAALLLLVRSAPERVLDWLIALLLAWLATALILLASGYCYRFLGERGLAALERLMGMLLVVMAVQMFLNGLREFLANGILAT